MRYLLEQPPDTEVPVLFSSRGSDQKIQCRNEWSRCPRTSHHAGVPGLPSLPSRTPREGRKTFLGSKAKEERSTSDTHTESQAPSSPYIRVTSWGPARSCQVWPPRSACIQHPQPRRHRRLQPAYAKTRKEKSVSVVKHVGNKIKTSQ